MNTVTESIYSSSSLVIPMADVQHIEKRSNGIFVITRNTRWGHEYDVWDNAIWIGKDEAQQFLRAWCDYRAELEADTLMDLSPDAAPKRSAFAEQMGAAVAAMHGI